MERTVAHEGGVIKSVHEINPYALSSGHSQDEGKSI
jgi:hypothetical protein